MADKIQWAGNTMPKSDDKHLGIMSLDHVKKARAFHQSFPQYTVTPLARLDGQAARLGLSNLCVKDESYRFGLNAFKVLGGSFAMANYIADETGKDVADCTFDYLTSDQLAEDFGQATFFTATDGNHGRGVAWAANKLGQKAVVHMPKGSTKPRFDNIAAEGATVTIEESTTTSACAWPPPRPTPVSAASSFRTPPGRLREDPVLDHGGLRHHASEAAEQLREMAINRPTHVFVQAGVGSLAGAWWATSPTCIPITRPPSSWSSAHRPPACTRALPPATATCASWTATCPPSWPVCAAASPTFWVGISCATTPPPSVSCPDWVTARGMRTLGAPREGRPARISGESGAVTTGLVETLMLDPEYAELKELIGLDKTSSVLCFSTEGDTDPDQYRRIVWEGEYPTC
mgnify:CR=1 FL=1